MTNVRNGSSLHKGRNFLRGRVGDKEKQDVDLSME